MIRVASAIFDFTGRRVFVNDPFRTVGQTFPFDDIGGLRGDLGFAYRFRMDPAVELDGFPAFGFDGAIRCIDDGVHNIAIEEGFARCGIRIVGVQHIFEHVEV